MVVWKFTIKEPKMKLMMPAGSKIVSIQAKDGDPQIWAICDPLEKLTERNFVAIRTGIDPIERTYEFIATVQINDLVFHIFENLGSSKP